MIVLRIVGILVALAGAAMVVFSVMNGGEAFAGVSQSLAAFTMIGGLLLAMAADAGAKIARKQEEAAQKKAGEKKPGA